MTNCDFRKFLDAVRHQGPSKPVPFGIVEYEAYYGPIFTLCWRAAEVPATSCVQIADDSDHVAPVAALFVEESRSTPGRTVSVVLRGADSSGASDSGQLSPEYGDRVVLKRPGLIVLVTVGDGGAVEFRGLKMGPMVPLALTIRAWRDDRLLRFDRLRKSEWSYANGKEDHPATNVSWDDAVAFCMWQRIQGGEMGTPYRLPHEHEWEAAATDAHHIMRKLRYPWGDTWRPELANTSEGGRKDTTPVGFFSPEGDSVYAVADMVGNVWEWCADAFAELREPEKSGQLWEDVRGPFRGAGEQPVRKITRMARGGSFRDSKVFARTTCRNDFDPDVASAAIGFRVAFSVEQDPVP